MTKEIEKIKNSSIQQHITINTDNSTTDNSTNTLINNYSSILSLTKEVIEDTFNKNYIACYCPAASSRGAYRRKSRIERFMDI